MLFYLYFLIPPLIAGLLAQAWVRRAFADGSKVEAVSGLTGAQVSRRMLDEGGLSDVSVEGISGELSDHYDPRTKTMRLSQPVGGSAPPPPPPPPPPSPPANTTPPAVSGSAQSGQALTASPGSWSGSPTSYAYQWQRCDSAGAACCMRRRTRMTWR